MSDEEGAGGRVGKSARCQLWGRFAAWQDEAARERWLPATPLVIRKANLDKSLRITWIDGKTSVEVTFYHKGPNKSQVTVEHRKLPGADNAARMKAYWAEALERLKAQVEGS